MLLEIQLRFSNLVNFFDFCALKLLTFFFSCKWILLRFLVQLPSLLKVLSAVHSAVLLELNMPNQNCLCAEFKS